MDIILFILMGLLAGWLAGVVIKGRGFGLVGNLVVGLIGALVGGLFFPILGITSTHIVGRILLATVGAILALVLVTLLAPRRRVGERTVL